MIEKPYILNGTVGRPVSAASLNVLQITGNAFVSNEKRTPTNHDVSAFLFAHFGDWAEVKRLAAKALSGGVDAWNEAVLDWVDRFFASVGILTAFESGELVAQMLNDAFGARVAVEQEGGGSGKPEIPQGGSNP